MQLFKSAIQDVYLLQDVSYKIVIFQDQYYNPQRVYGMSEAPRANSTCRAHHEACLLLFRTSVFVLSRWGMFLCCFDED